MKLLDVDLPDSGSEIDKDEPTPPKRKRKKRESQTCQSLVIAFCTPQFIRMCSSLQRSYFVIQQLLLIVSTHLSSCCLHARLLGEFTNSNEKQETIQAGLKLWKTILPDKAFLGTVLTKDQP